MRRRKPPVTAPDLSKRIRADREAAQMSQEQVARTVGVSLSAYRNWERVYPPPTQRLPEIAQALGLPRDHYIASEQEYRQVHEVLRQIESRQAELTEMMEERTREIQRSLEELREEPS